MFLMKNNYSSCRISIINVLRNNKQIDNSCKYYTNKIYV